MASKKEIARSEDLVWIDAGGGYSLALAGSKLVCRNAKGVRLSSVPPAVKESETAEQLKAVVDWLAQHGRECASAVEIWMLRSLPVPRAVLQAVWSDTAWRAMLENAVAVPVDERGVWSTDEAGFLRGADPERGLGLVNLDGETVWIDAPLAAIPHPILLPDLTDFRELATELGITQGVAQLFRETWPKPADQQGATTATGVYADARFEQLNHALGRARSNGFRVRGGWATCPVWEGDRIVEARYWLGSDYPESETWTGELSWVDEKERAIRIDDVGPVAYSEGNRMASLIYAGRVIPKNDDGVEETPATSPPTPPAPARAATPSPIAPANLLAAGGLALPGTDLPDKVPVDRIGARAYRHPALGERTVVRLTAEVLAPGEDRVMDFLGFGQPDESAAIALQRRRALGFPGWALVNDPDHASFALEVVKEFKKHARRAISKPGFAKEGFDAIGERLGRSVPHFLPPFYEEAGRAFLEAGNLTYAAQAFNKAREAERVHALPVDEEQRGQAFVDFALAGALTVKAISAYAKDLEKSYTPDVSYRHYRELCVRRTLGGLPPWAGMAKDLRSLAKSAGLDAAAEDTALLAELLQAPALSRAPSEFWTTYRKPLIALARKRADVRGTLLNLMPGAELDARFHGDWIGLLDECRALDALTEPASEIPEEAAASGGPAAWLGRALAHFAGRGYRRRQIPVEVFPLARRMAARLKNDGDPVTLCTVEWNSSVFDVDLLDLVLGLEVPVADPPQNATLGLVAWVSPRTKSDERQRDPVHVAADPRFAPLLAQAMDTVVAETEFQKLARGKKGIKPAWQAWFDARLTALDQGGLPGFTSNLDSLLSALSPEVLAEFPALRGQLAEVNTAGALARTLRAGVLDELGWPALDEAIDDLRAGGAKEVQFSGVFPYIVATDGRRAIAIGAKGRLLDHELRVPPQSTLVRFRYVDGQLLVVHRNQRWMTQGYWSSTPGDPVDIRGYSSELMIEQSVAVPVPGGGLTEGGRVMRAGDTTIDVNSRGAISDGETFWCHDWSSSQRMREYDPHTGEQGRSSYPSFFEEFTGDGWTFDSTLSWLFPIPAEIENSPLGSRDGLAGWRIRSRTQSSASPSIEAEGIDGRRWTSTAQGAPLPLALVRFPGDGRMRRIAPGSHMLSLWDPDDKMESAVAAIGVRDPVYARGSSVMLPLACWHFLQPRDEQGSRALREFTDDMAARLLDAACEHVREAEAGDAALSSIAEFVRDQFPAVTHPRLRLGIAGLAALAANARAQLAKAIETVDLTTAKGAPADIGIDETALSAALTRLASRTGYYYSQNHFIARQIVETGRFFASPSTTDPETRVPVAETNLQWEILMDLMGAIAFLATNEGTPDDHRKAMLGLLEVWANLPFASDRQRMRRWRATVGGDPLSALSGASGPGQWLAATETNRYLVRTSFDWTNGARGLSAVVVEYAAGGEFRALPGIEALDPVTFGEAWGDSKQIEAFLGQARERGPAPWDPAIAGELARRTGLTPAAATLLWLGCPNFQDYSDNFLPKDLRTKLGLKVAEAVAVRNELQSAFDQKGSLPSWVLALYGEVMQLGEDAIWNPLGSGPEDENSPVARFARGWVAKVGKRVAIPAELVVAATKDMGGRYLDVSEMLAAVAQPSRSPHFANDGEWVIGKTTSLSRREVVLSTPVTSTDLDDDDDEDDDFDGAEAESQPKDVVFGSQALSAVTHYIPYLFVSLPVGDPLRANLPELLALARKRLANPNLLLHLVSHNFYDQDEAKCAAKIAAFTAPLGGAPYAHEGIPADLLAEARDTGELIVQESRSTTWGQVMIHFRPSRVRDFDAIVKLTSTAESGYHSSGRTATDCKLLLSDGYTAFASRIADTPVPDGQWETNPLHATPGLVASVSQACGVSEDAAVLYLQTLALAEPTAKNVQTWNGWPPARYKKAAAELTGGGLLLEAKRERAGRAHFLPGAWIAFKSPNLPMEAWKLPLYGIGDKKTDYAKPLHRVYPLRPLHELFEEAWARISRGDKPEYEEV